MITTIIFDLSDVYLGGASGSGKHLEKKLGSDIADSDLLISELDQLFVGQMSEDEYWKIVIRKNSWDLSIEELKKTVRKNFKEIKGTREIIEELRKNGYKLGLLSNHVREWVQYCEVTYNYHQLFNKVLYSYGAKLSKPNKEIFLLILKQLQVKPQECLFIDDYENNIATAKKLGFNVIQFISAKNLKEKVKEFKIRI